MPSGIIKMNQYRAIIYRGSLISSNIILFDSALSSSSSYLPNHVLSLNTNQGAHLYTYIYICKDDLSFRLKVKVTLATATGRHSQRTATDSEYTRFNATSSIAKLQTRGGVELLHMFYLFICTAQSSMYLNTFRTEQAGAII